MPTIPKRNLIQYFTKNLIVVVALVLIWRGIWYGLDWLDGALFDGVHIYTVIGGIALGLALLYIPDKDLKEIEKL
ncbi:MAG: hypothetical protein HY455_03120 [Parcubacteria group bacterium]|nr:hypothetical protein [Parcubacteria group bacterium]